MCKVSGYIEYSFICSLKSKVIGLSLFTIFVLALCKYEVFTYGIHSPYTALSKLSNRQCLAPSITPVYIEAAVRLMTLFIIQFKRVNTTVVIIASNAQKKKY